MSETLNLETFRNYSLQKLGTSEDFPFDKTTLVLRVGGKIFAITDVEHVPFSMSLKCDPERAVELRERYGCITPGWHLNKKHWNSIAPDETIEDAIIYELIDHSYDLVFASLKRKDKEKISGAQKR